MKLPLIIPTILLVCFAVVGCMQTGDKNNPLPTRWDNVKFPRIDTVSIGIKSDSGHYALVTYYIKRTAKDTFLLDGSAATKIGNENWKVVTIKETLP